MTDRYAPLSYCRGSEVHLKSLIWGGGNKLNQMDIWGVSNRLRGSKINVTCFDDNKDHLGFLAASYMAKSTKVAYFCSLRFWVMSCHQYLDTDQVSSFSD